jgi:phage recombination protein Bet
MSNAIQRQEPSALDTLYNAEWPRTLVDVVRRQVAPKGIPDDDFLVFMKKCQQTGLNPLVGEVFCIPRNTKGPDGKHFTAYTFQPSAEGMRARAAKFPDFLSCDGAAVHQHDLVTMDQGSGEVTHKSNPAKPRGNIMGAWGRVTKRNGTRVLAWLPVGSRTADGPVWAKDPGGHLAKCAMVQALRQAYPVAFGGIYAREEMPNEEREPSRAEVVLGKVIPVKDEPAALPPPALGPKVEFGEWKDRAIAELSAEEKSAAITYAEWQVQQHPKMSAKVKAQLERNVAAIRASMESAPIIEDAVVDEPRDSLPISHPDAQPPEPGSEG